MFKKLILWIVSGETGSVYKWRRRSCLIFNLQKEKELHVLQCDLNKNIKRQRGTGLEHMVMRIRNLIRMGFCKTDLQVSMMLRLTNQIGRYKY